MSPTNFPTVTLNPTHADGSTNGGSATARLAAAEPAVNFDQLVVRVAAPGDRDALSDLARRAGAECPRGALMVGELDGRLVAAVSLDGARAVTEPTPSGAAAGAVARYRVAHLSRRQRGFALAA